MSITTYPLNDTLYQAEDAELFHCTRTSGIYSGGDFGFSVTGEDNSITIEPGLGWIRNSAFSGKVIAQREAETLDLGLPDSNLPRWDVVAIQFNKSLNLTGFVVKQGTASSNPAMPEISQTELLYELYICKVYRAAGAIAITAADVTDLRLDPVYCGIMADSITSVDTRGIAAQVAALLERLQAEIDSINAGTDVMLKSVYDINHSGIVDDARQLGGRPAAEYATSPIYARQFPASGEPMADGTIYVEGTVLSEYVLTSPGLGWAHGVFTTSDNPSITFAAGSMFAGVQPIFYPNTRYEFDVLDNIWAVMEVTQ